MKRILTVALLMLTGCGQVDFENAPKGTFEGAALVVWVGPNANSQLGDGKFLYVPRDGDELVFRRDPSANPSQGNAEIRPAAFYTDGGSIPRAAQSLRGFNAWGYGPAYVIHDWLFAARKCLNDNDATDAMKPIANMDFQESADVLAEAIKTLAIQYKVAGGQTVSGPVISSVTAGPISYQLWTETGQCADNKVSQGHLDLVDRINGREATLFDRSVDPTRRADPFQLPSGDVAVVVSVISLDRF